MAIKEEPIVSIPDTTGNGTTDSHPAFATATVHRTSSSGSHALFQSDVKHSRTIVLAINRATRNRDMNHDSVHPTETLVEIEMSMAQWGALVSSIGIGSGVPVTLRRTEGRVVVPDIPYEPRFKASIDEVGGSVAKLLADAKRTLAEVETAIESKAGVRAVRSALGNHRAALGNAVNNAQFAVDSMVGAGEAVVSQVRADIESQVLATTRLVDSVTQIAAPELHLMQIEAAPETSNDTSQPITNSDSITEIKPS